MAAHTLTIINQTLEKEITEDVCEQIEFACGHARGMDIPCISEADWTLVNEAAKTRIPKMLKTALENVKPRVAYQEAYRHTEHLVAVRGAYVRYDEEGWFERSQAWYGVSLRGHQHLVEIFEKNNGKIDEALINGDPIPA
jgi:hypothetical protein